MTYDEAKVYAWQAFQSRQPSLEDVIHAIRNAVNAQTAKLERELEAERDTLRKADALAAALEKYANKDNWGQRGGHYGHFDWFLIGNAGWDVADAALADWRKGE